MSNFKQMKKSEILALAQEVSASLKTIGAAELGRLAKGEGSSSSSSSEASLGKGSMPAEGSSSSASSGSPEGSAGGPPGAEGSASAGGPPEGDAGLPPPGAEGSAPPAGPPAGPPGAEGSAPPAGPPGAEGQAPAGPSFEELVSLYASLPPPDLEAHAAAMQQAMSMKQGASPSAGPGAPPAGPPGASPSAPPGAPPMGKQEVATADPNIGLKPGGGTPGHVETHNPNLGKTDPYTAAATRKSEDEATLARLTKNVEDLGKVIETILTVPQRKAATGLTVIPYQGNLQKSQDEKPLKKSVGDMTRAEVHETLKRVCATPKLTKAERDVVNEFYMNPGAVKLADLESIINKA